MKKAFDEKNNIDTYFWTDSTTVLAWIKQEENWRPFVWNRVEEIRKLTNATDWNFVPGTLNAADLPSRGCSATQLLKSRWWEGPNWLKQLQATWPQQEFQVNSQEVNEEKLHFNLSMVNIKTNLTGIYRKFSNFEKIVKVIGWIKRFIFNCRNNKDRRNQEQLQLEEVEEAETQLWKSVQG